MTPLLAALSSCRDAEVSAARVASRSPDSAAARKCRTAVLSDDLTLLLRSRAASLVPMRLIWDLMFATKKPRGSEIGWSRLDAAGGSQLARAACEQPGQATSVAGWRPNPGLGRATLRSSWRGR